MKRFKLASLSLIAGVAAAAMGVPASAQDVTLDQVLQAVRQERRDVSQENRERLQRFQAERNQQQALLSQVRQQVTAAAAESTRLEGVMEQNKAAIAELDQELASKQGEFQELFGA
ncbi:MAG: hypothetical protein KAH44_26465, partial [Oricola sp.]|nr:hypothetical protein [Oricola sp.]